MSFHGRTTAKGLEKYQGNNFKQFQNGSQKIVHREIEVSDEREYLRTSHYFEHMPQYLHIQDILQQYTRNERELQ